LFLGWIKHKRDLGKLIFLDICDSTGTIQVVVDQEEIGNDKIFQSIKKAPVESCIETKLDLLILKRNSRKELHVTDFRVIGPMTLQISPLPRSNFNIFDKKRTNHLFKNRHLYLKNEKIMAIMKYRHLMMGETHQWFRKNNFIEITAPILTELPLYDDNSAMEITVNGREAYLTQCVGFYLESAVAAFEKVYNIGPSFRGEESRSKRHLMEYWHIKAEIAFANLEDGRGLIEKLISHLLNHLRDDCQAILETVHSTPALEGLKTPYPCMTYRESTELLNRAGYKFKFGKSLGSFEESVLSRHFKTPFWVTGIPRSLEPFPYVIDHQDREVTRTSDLIASRGFGELLGVAEKIYKPREIQERMKEKGKLNKKKYQWVRDLRSSGFFPHVGFGMGVERFIRWALGIEHVREAVPFPRIFRRRIQP
jgi:asparaginyl-tRNA synthetase